MKNINLFLECNPNPIIEISRKNKAILYFNLAARVQFPLLEVEGLNASILQGIENSFSSVSASNGRLALMVREVSFHKSIFEQQIFSVADEDSIFVYMVNITPYKEIDKQAISSSQICKEAEESCKLQLKEVKSELKNSLEMFNKQREQDRRALRAANVATWNWHVPCDLITWDEGMNGLLGLNSTTYSGNFEAILNAIHPSDRSRISSEIRNSWLNDTSYDTQFRIMMPDGQVGEIRMKGKSYSDEHGQPVGLAGVCLTAASIAENVKLCLS